MTMFRWHSPRIAITSQAIETPRIKGKQRFNRIVRMLQSHGQCCPQFAPILGAGQSEARCSFPLLFDFERERIFARSAFAFVPGYFTLISGCSALRR
jgi:hypothetical protein